MPLARTPMDDKSSSAMRRYSDQLERAINAIAPWTEKKKVRAHPGVKPGEAVVMLEADDRANDPIYKGAKFYRGKR